MPRDQVRKCALSRLKSRRSAPLSGVYARAVGKTLPIRRQMMHAARW
jgi:hypothetical protein